MDASGQKANELKSEIYFLNTKLEMDDQICKIMGYKKCQFLFNYLGIALEKSSKSSKVWKNTFDKLDMRIGSWKDKWLSKVGKTTKISSILSTIPIFHLSYLPLSKNTLSKFEANLELLFGKIVKKIKKIGAYQMGEYM